MSLTSYRAAPPRGEGLLLAGFGRVCRSRSLPCKELSGGSVSLRLSGVFAFGRLGGDLLSRVLRRSTIGAEGFHGRVRDGIGCFAPRCGHQAIETPAQALWACAVPDSSWQLAKSERGAPGEVGGSEVSAHVLS